MVATLREVAAQAEVSVATASRAFQRPQMVGAATRGRILKAADDLGYSPNTVARALVTGRRGVLGVVVPDLLNPFYPAVLKGAQARAREHGVQLLLADAEEAPAGELPLVSTLAPQVDGIVLCSSRMEEESLRQAAALTRLALVNRTHEGLPGILADPGPGVRAAVHHLVQLGHRRIGYAGGPSASRSDADRRRTLRTECARAGAELVDVGHFAPGPEGGRQAAGALQGLEVTAVLVYNDVMALGMIDQLTSTGLRIPGDLSVIGWDDIEYAGMLRPGLSTVRVPRAEIGAAAIDVLLEAGSATEADIAHRFLPTELVLRGSTARAES
ncbi:LacI family transcriptional regulator [Brachybacterium endophyticum]|uniref:LacI family transcriptional regulator n=1 Tax=Brachybacterium endophyticum TaxID=2182385 RepID=A0A2U2RK53_9MICO|nr:LacI family DNA-binding transcriptional regulator [Brachybacterium endophyticum]PWH06259.1 LacI family transcriptional regulator [Brachybacterium endophyticum]